MRLALRAAIAAVVVAPDFLLSEVSEVDGLVDGLLVHCGQPAACAHGGVAVGGSHAAVDAAVAAENEIHITRTFLVEILEILYRPSRSFHSERVVNLINEVHESFQS